MADFFLHAQLIEDIYKKHPEYVNLGIAKIGAQGPDPFYYVIDKDIIKSSHMLADDMHDKNINDLLIAMTNYIKAHNTTTLRSYFRGFLAHFILDVHIHPYIYYNTGEYFPNKPKTHHYRGYHLRFERAVDIAYVYHRYQKEATSLHKTNRILPLKKVPDEILELFDHVGKKVYHIDHAGHKHLRGYLTMRKLLSSLIVDPLGIKKMFLSIVDLFQKHSPIMLKDYPYHKKHKKYDYLNINHKTWHHPITNEPLTSSVLDIYDHAFKELDETITIVFDYIDGKKDINLKDIFKNRSFNSGFDTSKPRTMKHFRLFDKKKDEQ